MIVPIATKSHHKAHIAPVAALLGVDGDMERRPAGPDDVAIVAAYGDLKNARRDGYRRIVMMQHGAGQSYGGDRRTAKHPSYPGGDDNDDVGLFLVSNQHAADRWAFAYPDAEVEIVGCPKLDYIPHRDGATENVASPVVAVSFHWDGYAVPEWRSAFDWYKHELVKLARDVTVIGHAHPNRRDLVRFYEHAGIEYVPDFDDVCRRADVYVCDNSSTLYEFASTGRPVVVLNAPWYRPEVNHGLRFWDAARVGMQVGEPQDFALAITGALIDPPWACELRSAALDIVYAYRTGAAQRAADVIGAWAGVEVAA